MKTNTIERLTVLAEKQVELEDNIILAETKLKALKAEHRELSEETIPAVMEDIGVDELKLSSGATITIQHKVRCGHLKSPTALQKLVDDGQAGMIKSDVQVAFGRQERDSAGNLIERLRGEGFQVKSDEHVHSSTLAAYLRRKLEDGVPIDLESFGAIEQVVAKVDMP